MTETNEATESLPPWTVHLALAAQSPTPLRQAVSLGKEVEATVAKRSLEGT